jgi:methionine-S-sulfoxide reductase
MRFLALPVLMLAAGCGGGAAPPTAEESAYTGAPERSTLVLDPADADTAVFAMGCFWCAETAFEGLPGISTVTSGFAGGTVPNPTYDQVTAGGTGHYEAVQVVYAPAQVGYAELLRVFWHNVDPFDAGGQFCDRGDSYRSAIFSQTAGQDALADSSLSVVEDLNLQEGQVVTAILPGGPFYPAEDYHQDFWLKDPARYTSYRTGCRRDERLDQVWGSNARVAGDEL